MTLQMSRLSLALALSITVFPLLSGCSGGDKSHHSSTPPRHEETPAASLTLVSQWNELALAGVRDSGAKPTVTTRQLFILSTAMYDAWSTLDAAAVPYALDPTLKLSSTSVEADKARAVSQAAYQILIRLFPALETKSSAFSANMTRLGYPMLSAGDDTTPDGIGYLAAEAVLAARADDGSNAANGYADAVSARFPALYVAVNSPNPAADNGIDGPDYNPNRWQPLRVPNGTLKDADGLPIVDNNDPATFSDQKFLTPHWGNVTPFALSSADEFVPSEAPPELGNPAEYTDALGNVSTSDEAWNRMFDQVLSINANLTDYQRSAAEFWADGPRTESPPGHWNQLAHGVSARDKHGIDEDIKMYFALNGALMDAGISVWNTKRIYDSVRPACGIVYKYKGQTITAWVPGTGEARQIDGHDWHPYQNPTFVTPGFPEYISGHSTFSRSAAEVLTAFTGSPNFYDGTTVTPEDVNKDGKPDLLGEFIMAPGALAFDIGPSAQVVLSWPTFVDAANEAGISRLYGGIHIQDGDLRGREVGRQVGLESFAKAQSYWTGTIVP